MPGPPAIWWPIAWPSFRQRAGEASGCCTVLVHTGTVFTGHMPLSRSIHNTCIGTGTQNTLDDYYQRKTPVNDTHGIGPVILAASAVS